MNKPHNCVSCGDAAGLGFCPICGKIIRYPSFVNDDDVLKERLEQKVVQLVKNANDIQSKILKDGNLDAIADVTARRFNQHIDYLKMLCADKTGDANAMSRVDFEVFTKEAKAFADDCMSNELQIAVVGIIKAGKSTLMNAIIGKRLASVDLHPETAVLTRFRKSPQKNYLKIVPYSRDEWASLLAEAKAAREKKGKTGGNDFLSSLEKSGAEKLAESYIGKNLATDYFDCSDWASFRKAVERYTSTKSKDHFFIKEIEIGLEDFAFADNIVFVDTPGLSDPVAFRSNLTKEYLKRAKIVLLCRRVDNPALEASQLYELGQVFHHMTDRKNQVYLLATQFDVQYPAQEVWDSKTKPAMEKILKDSAYFDSLELAQNHVFPLSPYVYFEVNNYLSVPEEYQDKALIGKLMGLIDNLVGRPDPEELSRELGEEEGDKRFLKLSRLSSRLDLQKDAILAKTHVKDFFDNVLGGLVKDSVAILAENLEKKYKRIIRESIVEPVSRLTQEQSGLLLLGNDVEKISTKIEALEKEVGEKKQTLEKIKMHISDSFEKLEDRFHDEKVSM